MNVKQSISVINPNQGATTAAITFVPPTTATATATTTTMAGVGASNALVKSHSLDSHHSSHSVGNSTSPTNVANSNSNHNASQSTSTNDDPQNSDNYNGVPTSLTPAMSPISVTNGKSMAVSTSDHHNNTSHKSNHKKFASKVSVGDDAFSDFGYWRMPVTLID